jgi:mannose-6-phosphate isomerase-like protein (cupin superfamily)
MSATVTTTPGREQLVSSPTREASILVARHDLTIIEARYAAGEPVAGPHIHHRHTDAFYVLEGGLILEIGREAQTITLSPGGCLAAPPGLAHSLRVGGNRSARWLTIHGPDGGFAAFMRGLRDGGEVEWDIAPVPADGGLPASSAVISPGLHRR